MTTIGLNIDDTSLASISEVSMKDSFNICVVCNDSITTGIVHSRLIEFIKNLGGNARVTVNIDRTSRTHIDNDLF